MGGHQPIVMENIPNVLPFDTTQVTSKANYSNPKYGDPCHPLCSGAHPPAVAYCIAGNMVDRETTMHGTGVSEEISSTLTAVDRHAVMSTVGGQSAYAIGNGQWNQSMMTDKAGALNCMHDQIAVMQEVVTENKLSEACAPTMGEDSTDRM